MVLHSLTVSSGEGLRLFGESVAFSSSCKGAAAWMNEVPGNIILESCRFIYSLSPQVECNNFYEGRDCTACISEQRGFPASGWIQPIGGTARRSKGRRRERSEYVFPVSFLPC